MKWPRYIVHADLNHCYAQIEEMFNPRLRAIPMAVGGDEEKRRGIILAKNDIAREYGIKTAETLRDAICKCPNLYIVSPNYERYAYYTERVKDIYRRYTDKVESFGLDEAWIDLTESTRLFGDPIKLAQKIQKEVYRELGLVVSMGISFNKVFAKLGSDMDKRGGFITIGPDDYKEKIYDKEVSDLLYVGRATKDKLERRGIYTIGDIATQSPEYLKQILGKVGVMLWRFAKGYDDSEVKDVAYRRDVKSVSNGITAVRDLKTIDDVRMIMWVLAEAVASRLKDMNKVGMVVSINMRDTNLMSFSRQRKLTYSTDLADEICDTAMSLVKENVRVDRHGYLSSYFRSITVGVSQLSALNTIVEYDLFDNEIKRDKERRLEVAIDTIRSKYGFAKAQRLVTKYDAELTDFDPKGDHTIHPESWF